MRQYSLATVALLGLAALTTGCAEPPKTALDAATQAQQTAVAAGAPDYAPESYRALQDAQANLDAEMKVQIEKMAVLRSYEKASELALAAKMAAEKAEQDAIAGRETVRTEATALIADAKAAVAAAEATLAKAPGGKGTRQDLAALAADLQAASGLATEAEAAFVAGQFSDARTKAEASKAAAMVVTTAVEQAVAARRPRR